MPYIAEQSRPAFRTLTALIVAFGLVSAGPVAADVCNKSLNENEFKDKDEKRNLRYCVVAISDGSGGWAFKDNLKNEDLLVGVNDTADIVFEVESEPGQKAWLARIEITPAGGESMPEGEFEGEDGKAFKKDTPIVLNGKRKKFKVKNKNTVAGVYDYTVWVGTDGGETEVDPRIRNGGREN
jgi:hypothetical protein